MQKKIDNISKERDLYYNGYLKCKQKGLKAEENIGVFKENITNLQEIDAFLMEIEREDEEFLEKNMDSQRFADISGKGLDSFEKMFGSFARSRENLEKILDKIHEICEE